MSTLVTFICLLGTIIYVVYLVVRPKLKTEVQHSAKNQQLLAALKSNAMHYDIDFDHCEFKDSSFVSEVEEDNTDAKMAGLVVGSSIGFFNTRIVTEETTQSVLVLSNPGISGGKRFFQTFAMDVTTLKYHVLSDHVRLLVDKMDNNKYYFELTA